MIGIFKNEDECSKNYKKLFEPGFIGKVDEIYAVGDCRNPQLIADAIGEGYRIACHL
jgi:hypothetical protein